VEAGNRPIHRQEYADLSVSVDLICRVLFLIELSKWGGMQ
jgi:hypothetical protein